MAAVGRPNDVALVDAFLAQDKLLSGAPPEFGPRARGKQGANWDAIWPIANKDGIVEAGSLRVNYAPASEKPFSIILIFRAQCVFRLDFVEDSICHSNPYWARKMAAPPLVRGPHVHRWDMNRDHVLRQGMWDLPCRVPIPPQIRRFDQAFPWFADEVNLTLRPSDRSFDLPLELV